MRYLSPGPSLERLKQFAARGLINPEASVSARVETTIAAPADRVWRLISEAGRWHDWHPAVRVPDSAIRLSECGSFVWKSNGFTVNSEVMSVQTNKEICWVGTAMGSKAVHAWRLSELGPNLTSVETEESMDGPLIGLLYNRAKLTDFLSQWLTRLKAECERQPV